MATSIVSVVSTANSTESQTTGCTPTDAQAGGTELGASQPQSSVAAPAPVTDKPAPSQQAHDGGVLEPPGPGSTATQGTSLAAAITPAPLGTAAVAATIPSVAAPPSEATQAPVGSPMQKPRPQEIFLSTQQATVLQEQMVGQPVVLPVNGKRHGAQHDSGAPKNGKIAAAGVGGPPQPAPRDAPGHHPQHHYQQTPGEPALVLGGVGVQSGWPVNAVPMRPHSQPPPHRPQRQHSQSLVPDLDAAMLAMAAVEGGGPGTVGLLPPDLALSQQHLQALARTHMPGTSNSSVDSFASTASASTHGGGAQYNGAPRNVRGGPGNAGAQGPGGWNAGHGNTSGGNAGMSRDRRGNRGSFGNLQSAAGGGGHGKPGYQGRNGTYNAGPGRMPGLGGAGSSQHSRASMEDLVLSAGHQPHPGQQGGAANGPRHPNTGAGARHDGSAHGGDGPNSSLPPHASGLGDTGAAPGGGPAGLYAAGLPEPRPTTDLERFMMQITPMIPVDSTAQSVPDALSGLRLEHVWRFYLEPSLYGREVYTLGGARGPSLSYFVPYLSAIQLFTPAGPQEVAAGTSGTAPGTPSTGRLYVSDTDSWPKHMSLRYELFETELPFNRHPMYEQLERLAERTPQPPPLPGTAPAPSPPRPVAAQPKAANPTPGSADGAAAGAAQGVAAKDVGVGSSGPSSTPASGSEGSSGGAEVSVGGSIPETGRGDGETPPPAADDSAGLTEGSTASTGASGDAPRSADGSTGSSGGVSRSGSSDDPAGPVPAPAPVPSPAPSRGLAGINGLTGDVRGPSWLHDTRLSDLHPASWYCVAWYPVYRIPDAPLNTRFLTFHSFAPLVTSIHNALESLREGAMQPVRVLPMGVVGLKWNNMHGERWLEPLTLDAPSGTVCTPGGGKPGESDDASSVSGYSSGGRGGRGRHAAAAAAGARAAMDTHFQAHLSELQATAERLARGYGVRVHGAHGIEECRQRHPDFEFFNSRA